MCTPGAWYADPQKDTRSAHANNVFDEDQAYVRSKIDCLSYTETAASISVWGQKLAEGRVGFTTELNDGPMARVLPGTLFRLWSLQKNSFINSWQLVDAIYCLDVFDTVPLTGSDIKGHEISELL